MLYIIGLVILLFAIIIIYTVRVISSFLAAHKAHRAARRGDPEAANPDEVPPRPSLRQIAREVTHIMFPPREQDPAVPLHRRSSGELYRSNYGVAATAVQRTETRDPELPTYLESHNMPKPPAAIYAASTAHPTASRTEADEASAPPGLAPLAPPPSHGAPPQYDEHPIVRQG